MLFCMNSRIPLDADHSPRGRNDQDAECNIDFGVDLIIRQPLVKGLAR